MRGSTEERPGLWLLGVLVLVGGCSQAVPRERAPSPPGDTAVAAQPLTEGAPLLASEVRVDVPLPGPLPGQQASPVVAWGGGCFLVVWEDARREGQADVYAARVGADGTLLDSAPLALAASPEAEVRPQVASNGTDFFVVWRRTVGGSTRLEATVVSAGGQVLPPRLLHETALGAPAPVVASDGEGALVAWQQVQADGSGALGLVRLAADGSVRDVPVRLLPSDAAGGHTALTFVAGGYLLLSSHAPAGLPASLQARRLERVGEEWVAGAARLVVEAGSASLLPPAVASDAGGVLVAWREADGQPVQALRLDAQGAPVEAAPLPLSGGGEGAPALAWTGTHFLVVWAEGAQAQGPTALGRRVRPDGTLPDAEGLPLSAPGALRGAPAVASAGRTSLLVSTAPEEGPEAQGLQVLARLVTEGTPPRVASLSLTTAEDTPLPLPLQVEDDDCDTFTFLPTRPPDRGSVEGSWPHLTYVPAPDVHGPDAFAFRVQDCTGASSEEALVQLTVTPVNDAPHISGLHPLTGLQEGEASRFSATVTDAEGDALQLQWDFGDGTTSSETAPRHTFANEGVHTVRLTVSDGLAQVVEEVHAWVGNAPPVLQALEAPAAGTEGEAFTFRAQASDPGVHDVLTYHWDFGDGSQQVGGGEVVHRYADNGSYPVQVTVVDEAGARAEQALVLEVANLPPVVQEVAHQRVRAGHTLSLQLAASDPGGAADPLLFVHRTGPGTLTPEGLWTWTPDTDVMGHHVVRVTVLDDDGAQEDLAFIVTVDAAVQLADVGCHCGAAGSVGLLPALLLLGVRRRRAA